MVEHNKRGIEDALTEGLPRTCACPCPLLPRARPAACSLTREWDQRSRGRATFSGSLLDQQAPALEELAARSI